MWVGQPVFFLEPVYSPCIYLFAADVDGTAGLFCVASLLTVYYYTCGWCESDSRIIFCGQFTMFTHCVLTYLQLRWEGQLTYFSEPVCSLSINIFAADVGGTAGLFLGASLLTVMEFGEFFLLVAISILKRLCGTNEPEQKYPNDKTSSVENVTSVDEQKTSGIDYYSPEYGFSSQWCYHF